MLIHKLNETGIAEAIRGFGLSFGLTSPYNSETFIPTDVYDMLFTTCKKLAYKQGGENKFLRFLVVYLDITAPLYFWKQYDTYKVGTSTLSESTMHTIHKHPFSIEMFDTNNMNDAGIEALKNIIELLNNERDRCLSSKLVGDIIGFKKRWYNIISLLPDSFLQRRISVVNYAVLQNMVENRHNHKLAQWREFCNYVKNNTNFGKYFLMTEEERNGRK